ncbi:MAG: ceramidase domain-containing protein [Rhodospirillales bacterium]|nr:ceramidase domain-containing protein [Rhodospirillales bacterium]
MFDFSLPYHSYCEIASGPIAEPFNALSCLAFWIAAIAIWLQRDDESSDFHQVAAVVLFVLGVSGMMWHGTLDRLAFGFDIIAIYMLMALVVTMLCNNILKWPLWASLITVTALIFFSAWLRDSAVPWLPQQGGAFLPALLFLSLVALAIQPRYEQATVYLLAGAYALFFGLAFRSVDLYLCLQLPIGTHFLWHIFVAIFVIYVTKALAATKVHKSVLPSIADTAS